MKFHKLINFVQCFKRALISFSKSYNLLKILNPNLLNWVKSSKFNSCIDNLNFKSSLENL